MNDQVKCPVRNFHAGPYSLEKLPDHQYRCSCGCVFEWFTPWHWRVLQDGHAAALFGKPNEDSRS